MKRSVAGILFILILLPVFAAAFEISSIAPSRGEPGTEITVTGGPFSRLTRVRLGEKTVPVHDVNSRILRFFLPDVQPGEYVLSLEHVGEEISLTQFIEILEPTPLIGNISPRNIDACGTAEEQSVQVDGRFFLDGASLLFDGVSVPMERVDSGQIRFFIPSTMRSGVHGIQVRNSSGKTSLPHSLWVNDIPSIDSIERGEDYVNHFEIIIHGRNFYFNSILSVTQPNSRAPESDHRSRIIYSDARGFGSNPGSVQQTSDRLVFRDCRTLIYERYPSSSQVRDLFFQVINPDGKKSEPFGISLP